VEEADIAMHLLVEILKSQLVSQHTRENDYGPDF